MEHNVRGNPSVNHEVKSGKHVPKIMEVVSVALVIALFAFALGYMGVMFAGGSAASPTGKQAAASGSAPLKSVLPSAAPAETPELSSLQSVLPSAAPAATQELSSLQSVLPSAAPAATPELSSLQSVLPSAAPAATPDPEYPDQLRKNAVVVNTDKEFDDALNARNAITLKKDITLNDIDYYLSNIPALIIDEGVTLTITSLNFYATCSIYNFGEIIVDGRGRLVFSHEPDYSCIGKISTKGRDARICFNAGKIGADEIAYFLREGSLYNWLYIVASSSGGNFAEILIDHDIVIPAGKTLWINCDSVLHVPEGVTLTNNGQIRYYNKPIIEGKIDGIGRVVYDD